MGKDWLEIKKSAVKEINNLSRRDLRNVLDKIADLSDNPRPHDCKKLSA